jgi:hypothetical protein
MKSNGFQLFSHFVLFRTFVMLFVLRRYQTMGQDAVIGAINNWLSYIELPELYPDYKETREEAVGYVNQLIATLASDTFKHVVNRDVIVQSSKDRLFRLTNES